MPSETNIEFGPSFPSAASGGAWLSFNPTLNEIRLINPRLPSFLDEVILRQLRLGNSSLDLAKGRHYGEVSLRVLRREGRLRVAAIHT
jgi:hypothetical protein